VSASDATAYAIGLATVVVIYAIVQIVLVIGRK
jgi:hypothetical protein